MSFVNAQKNCCRCGDGDGLETPCGHYVHPICLYRQKFCCPGCNRAISNFELLWNIFRVSGMNPSESFYKELSGCSNWQKGLIKWLFDNDADGAIFNRIEYQYSMYGSTHGLESIHSLALEETFLRRDVRTLKSGGSNVKIDKSILDVAWDRGDMEILAKVNNLSMLAYDSYNIDRDPLMVAAKTGNFNLLEKVISYGVNLNRHEGRTSRISAFNLAFTTDSFHSIEDRLKFLDLLLKNGLSVNQCSEGLFEKAIEGNEHRLVEYLISKGERPDPESINLAIKNSAVKLVKLLHESGVKFTEKGAYNNNPSSLRLACEKGSFSIVKYIIESGFNFRKENDLLNNAINGGRLDILEMFLSYGVQPCHDNLKVACSKGNFKMVKLLIEYGADPRENNTKNCGLFYHFNFESVLRDKKEKLTEIIDYFLRIGIFLEDETFFYKLSQHDSYLPIIEKLLELNAYSRLLSKAFLKACYNGCQNIARCLIRNGANVNYFDPSGMNGYLHAICSGNLETVKIALAFSDKNHVDDKGNGPLYYICGLQSGKKADVAIFDFLTAEGVNMNILDKQRKHPLLDLKISEKKYKFLMEKYCENEENINYQFCGSLEDLFLIKGKPEYSDTLRFQKEAGRRNIKLKKQ